MAKMKKGLEHSVPCPWCERRNDFREVKYEAQLGGYEVGSTIQCDHCERHMEVKQVQPTTIIGVIRAQGPGGIPQSIGGRG